MKRAITFLLFTLFVMSMSAYDFKSGNFYYNITSSNTVEVTYQDGSSDNYLGLTFATIPETVTYNDITYSVTSIGEWAFSYCSSLASVTIGNSVTSIGNGAFYFCSSLTSVTIPNSVTSIGSQAFSFCSSLTSVTIPESVTSIGDWAFEHCYGFDAIYANKMSPPSIGVGVFAESTPVCYIPCGAKAAYEASDWASQVRKFVELCEEKYTTLTYTSTDGNIVTPEETEVFGANIVSNEYKDGQGVITFDGPVTSIGDDAFSGCSSLASITIPNSVTVIGDAAFNDCSSLTSIAIPNSVTSIHTFAFARCSSLVEIEIPKSVISIGDSDDGRLWACQGIFMGCNNLQKIVVEEGNPIFDSRDNCNAIIETATNTLIAGCPNTEIPNGIKKIGTGAFRDCNALGDIDIPSSVNVIGEAAFYGTGITKVVIPSNCIVEDATYSSTYTVLFGAFARCEQLTEVVIPEGTTRIASGMLAGCSSLESLTIPASVTSIGEWAFYDCDALTSITIPNGVTSIEEGTFMRCYKLTSITIPRGVTNIGYYAFGECSLLASVTCEATTPPMLEDLKGSPVFTSSPICYIPCGTKSAYEASDWAQYVSEFVEEDCPEPIDPTWQITYTSTDGNIVTPDETDVFGANIVSNEYKDGQGVITFDGPVTSIGEKAFYYCQNLASIFIPNSVTRIGSRAFDNCDSLTSVTIGNSVKIIGQAAFSDCSSLTSITIPSSVTSIGSHAFYRCSDLTSITIPSSVTSIGNGAFSSCSSLTSVTIPNSVTSIENGAFSFCSSLTSVTIPNTVTSIENEAFYNCFSLTSITIPSSVTSIGNGAFSSCFSLTSVTIPNSVTSIEGSAFSSCSSLTSVTIPNSVTSIGDWAFEHCISLTSVTIPNSVTSIGRQAFFYCRLTSISLPESVTSIGDRAFEHCYGFDTIYANKMTPPSIGEGVFAESSPVCYVPCGAKAAYEASDWASHVRKFVELCEEKYTTLTYTSTDGNIVIPSNNDAFGANIVGNTYENGEGAIIFDGPVTTIGYHAFTGCYTLASINIPNTVTSIGEYAFGFCTNLTELRIPKSVTSLGADEEGVGIVYQAPNLQRIIVEEGNPVYDSRNNCNAIIETATNTLLSGCKNTNIPSGIKTIGAFAFWGCADLQTIEMPTSVKTFKQGVFYETGLTRFIIPSNVTIEDATYQNTQTIRAGIFAGCKQLTEVVIPEGTTRIASGMLAGCSSLESLTIPASVTSIGKWAFYNCDALTSITIPDGVMSIENGAFYGCSLLTSITIPSDVTSIGGQAFEECSSLNTITCEATTPPMLEDLKGSPVFTSSPICYIPCGTKAAYEASDWAQYVSKFVEDCDNGSYSRNVRIGYNTICLPHGSSNFTGATFYEIAHILKNKKKIFFDEVKTLEAGKPYIFYPHSNEVTVYYDNTTSAVPLSHNGLHGTFDGITAASNFLKGKYLVAGDRMVLCGDGCSLAANRAYIELDEISDKDHPAIPGIKRVSMDYSEENATTALDNITDESIVAPMQEGVYDILGRKVDAPTVSGFYIINGKKVFVK